MIKPSSLPIHPQDAVKNILAKLPLRRMRDVLIKRAGLKGGRKYTLEAIGKEYKITRERVRQIEADAVKNISKGNKTDDLKPFFGHVEEHVRGHGGVMAEHHLFTTLVENRYHPHVSFLMDLGPSFHPLAEKDHYYKCWTVDKDMAGKVEKIVQDTVRALDEDKKPVSREQLFAIMSAKAKETLGAVPEEKIMEAYLHTSKLIRQNPYGEYGLVSWPSINPKGVRDKAYAVLEKCGQSMHFRQVAQAINKVGWSRKKAHPQTVHNELIKDSRFVLVGRGLYGLKQWGYEPGAVRDVMISVLKQAGKPLSKEEIINTVLEKRVVKPPTVFLNLQNKTLFKKTGDGKFTLV